jgi:hypothetical protein
MSFRLLSLAAIVSASLPLGCTSTDETPSKPGTPKPGAAQGDSKAPADPAPNGGSDEAVEDPSAAERVEACAAVARLYPKDKLADDGIQNQLVHRQWSRRDGGRGSIHGPPMKTRITVDLGIRPAGRGVTLAFESKSEATGEAPNVDSWTKQCHVCGHVLVCGDEAMTVGVREVDKDGKLLRVLDSEPVVALTKQDLYLIRHGHEVRLTFGADPREEKTGPLDIAVRKLEGGAPVVRSSVTYENEGARGVKVVLPGDIGGFRVEFRGDDRPPYAGGSGKRGLFAKSLYDFETLIMFPDMMRQPASLDIEPGEEGTFNKPHRFPVGIDDRAPHTVRVTATNTE